MQKFRNKYVGILIGLVVVGLAVRFIVAASMYGFKVDMDDFAVWGSRMVCVGPAQFYAGDYWCDYPPGYLLVVWAVSFIGDALHASYASPLWLIVHKSPAIICDCACAVIMWNVVRRFLNERPHSEVWALMAAGCYLLNPAGIVDSAAWGQVDGVLAFFLVLMFACYMRGVMIARDTVDGEGYRPLLWMVAGSALWALGITMKMQGIIVAPAVFFAFLLLIKRERKMGLIALAASIVTAFVVVLAVLAPFAPKVGFAALISRFMATLGSYELASVNALNFFTMVGAGWVGQSEPFLGLTYRLWGTIALVLLVIFTFACFIRAWKTDNRLSVVLPVLMAAVLVVGFFTFSVRVHERYLFCAIPLLLMAAALYRDVHLTVAFCLVTAIETYNMIIVMNGAYLMDTPPFQTFACGVMVATCLYVFARSWQLSGKVEHTANSACAERPGYPQLVEPNEPNEPIECNDPIEPTESVESPEPIESTKPLESLEPIESAEPAGRVE